VRVLHFLILDHRRVTGYVAFFSSSVYSLCIIISLRPSLRRFEISFCFVLNFMIIDYIYVRSAICFYFFFFFFSDVILFQYSLFLYALYKMREVQEFLFSKSF
jgi:hypothetical protein